MEVTLSPPSEEDLQSVQNSKEGANADKEDQNMHQHLLFVDAKSKHNSSSRRHSSPGENGLEESVLSNDYKSERKRNLTVKKKSLNQSQEEELSSKEGSFHNSRKPSFKRVLEECKDEFGQSAYNYVVEHFPPLPILPRNLQIQKDSPKSGGKYPFLKLIKFKGKDDGKAKLNDTEEKFQQIEFPEKTTLKTIFLPNEEAAGNQTLAGQIVFMRSALDFTQKQQMPGTKKDEVLDENLIDVKRLLKNSTNGQGGQSKKGLVNLMGVQPYYTKKDQFDRTLMFESRFESGNLAAALKVNDNDYHLLLQNDVNTSGHTQWFFFRVQNTTKHEKVRFNMLNLSKPDSLFNEGMKVLIYSEKLSEEKDIGWHRGGQNIGYYQNGIQRECQKKKKSFYTMTFSYEFQYSDDSVFFAYCYPYTYTDLVDELNKITTDSVKSQFCTRKVLCETLAGNKCEVLTITSKQNLESLNKRKGVVITARVHPGESVGSWMMKGAIDFLTDENSEEAEILRQNYVFKVIPMLNPDGVINGNYRCSLAGCDLNRRWKAPSKTLHDTIYSTKQLMASFSKERELVCFCDFHGHSRRKNVFMYGCNNPSSPEDTRMYPFLLSKISPIFIYNYSRFGNQKSKEATARVALFNEFKIPAIYTMESSFCGSELGPLAGYHFSTDNLMQMGKDFCRTLQLYHSVQVSKPLVDSFMDDILSLYEFNRNENEKRDTLSQDQEVEAMKVFLERIQIYRNKGTEINTKQIKKALQQVLRRILDIVNDEETSNSAGSDQAPSDDNLELEEIKKVVPVIEEELPKGVSSKKKGMTSQEIATSISPLRRKTTVDTLKKRNSTIIQPKKRMSLMRNLHGMPKKQDSENQANLKVTSSKITTIDESLKIKEEDKEEGDEIHDTNKDQEDQVATEEAGVHKKKRKRNVESRDVWTQTERSDYFLIKYRQQQKRDQEKTMPLAQSNPLALPYYQSQLYPIDAKEKQNQLYDSLPQKQMNQTQDLLSASSSLNMAITKLFKDPASQSKQGQKTVSKYTNGRMVGGSANYAINHQYVNQQSENFRENDGGPQQVNTYSRNQLQSQNNSKNKTKSRGSVREKGMTMAGSNVLSKHQNHLVKTQWDEQILSSLEQPTYSNWHPSQHQRSLGQRGKDISRSQNRPKPIKKDLQYQNILPTIYSPVQQINPKQQKLTSDSFYRLKQQMDKQKHEREKYNQSGFSSSHSTQRLKELTGGDAHIKIQEQSSSFTESQSAQNDGKKLREPQGYLAKSQPGQSCPQSKYISNNKGQTAKNNDNPSRGQQDLSDIRVLENTFIQQKLLQQSQQNKKSPYSEVRKEHKNEHVSRRKSSIQQQNLSQSSNFFQSHGMQPIQSSTLNQMGKKGEVGGLQGQSMTQGYAIQKLLESQWRVHHQQPPQPTVLGTKFSKSSNQQPSQSNTSHSQRPRRNIEKKFDNSPQLNQTNQFINVKSMVPTALNHNHNTHSGQSGVRVNIVNVHNEFNINNKNLTISNPQPTKKIPRTSYHKNKSTKK